MRRPGKETISKEGESIMGKTIKKGCAGCAKKAAVKKASAKKPAKKGC